MIDYKSIIEQLNTQKVINLMETLGATDYIEKPGYVIFPTICHNEDSEEASMKLYYYENTHIFMCYTEEGAMSIFQFLKNYYEARSYDYDWYEDIYKVILDCSNYRQLEGFTPQKYKSIRSNYTARDQVRLPTYPNGIIDCFTKFYPPEWLNDGITKQSMDKFNIRYSVPQNKIIIPHYNVNGELIGIRGRALNEWEIENVGKYMPVQIEGKWYSHPLSLNLYGLNWTKDNIKRIGVCFLCESEKAVLQMDGWDFANCAVAVCGSQFNKHALKLLLTETHPKEIVICFDKEEKPGSEDYFNKLWLIGKKYQNYCDFSFIYDRENLLCLKDSPTDKGSEIFWKLYNKRVRIK